uniref:Uncharacterized protein n=1 Tax=Myotis myotis TaxID=51298 RepID=A0A7J7V405_MYOMY|nr:hypothetical protein mMyoMyo1_008515 [Myotis myotis]
MGKSPGVFLDDSGLIKPVPPLPLAQVAHRHFSTRRTDQRTRIDCSQTNQTSLPLATDEQLGCLQYLLMGTPSQRGLTIHHTSCWPGKTQTPFHQACVEPGEPGGDRGFRYCPLPKELPTLLPTGTR